MYLCRAFKIGWHHDLAAAEDAGLIGAAAERDHENGTI